MKLATKFIHAGVEPDPSTGSIMTPIYQTSTYVQEAPGKNKGYEYARSQNPTRFALEKAFAEIENGKYGLAFSSGVAATDAVIKLLQPGDEVIAASDMYGGTYRLFTKIFEKFGIVFHYVNMHDANNILALVNAKTRLIWTETPTNPLMNIVDIAAVAAISKAHNILLCVDNTFATPYLQQPFKYDVDFAFHSTTKFLNGHGTAIGGVLLGRDIEFMNTKATKWHRLLGGNSNPFDAFLLTTGMKTLEIRMERHCSNAVAVVDFLQKHPAIGHVNYNGLESHPDYATAKKQMRHPGAMTSFELKGGLDAGKKFIDALQMCVRAVSLGTVDTLVSHPASMTHYGVSREERIQFGITDGLIRMSVGMENIEDILADLEQALN